MNSDAVGTDSHNNEQSVPIEVAVDVLIVGGGIAGLWALARFQQAGFKTVLLESKALGAGQTRYAQGIIHGGTKYALTGKLTASSEAVADMPSRWRACYEGKGELDLTQAELLSNAHYLWSTSSLTSRLAGFFSSKVMRSRSLVVDDGHLPRLFQHKNFKGQFYRLDEPVFNTLSVIRAIAEPRRESILMTKASSVYPAKNCMKVEAKNGDEFVFNYKKIIFMAGQGNKKLLLDAGLNEPEMQLRPLKMVVLRGVDNIEMVYAHCLSASVNPRITITSHYDEKGNIVWYMGGQLAEDGVNKSNAELIQAAEKELKTLIPWLDLNGAEWGVLKIDRAEIKKSGATRPDSFTINANNNIITAWPTKLALAPALAEELLNVLKKELVVSDADNKLPAWPVPEYADFPWNEAACWKNESGKINE